MFDLFILFYLLDSKNGDAIIFILILFYFLRNIWKIRVTRIL